MRQRPARLLIFAAPALAGALLACGEKEPLTAPELVEAAAVGDRVVNSLADPGDGVCNAGECTLREAIRDPASTRVTFASGLTGTITLAAPGAGGGTLVVDHSVVIDGPAGGVVVRRASGAPSFRILRVLPDIDVALLDLTLRNGVATVPGGGGGIVSFGKLSLTRCVIAGNAATGGGAAGIDSHGSLTLTGSRVEDNAGIGILQRDDGTLTLRNTTVARNSGTGIRNDGGTLEMTGGAAMNNGGGISARRGASTLEHVRVVENRPGGGISVFQGSFTLTNSTIARNSGTNGGGIAVFAARVDISRTTIANNTALGHGGGIFNTTGDPFGRLSSTVTLVNSTVSHNLAALGGGIDDFDDLGGANLVVRSSTIVLNSAFEAGGGIRQQDGIEQGNGVSLSNTLVALNTAPAGPDVQAGEGIFARFSLIGNGSGSGLTNTDGNQVGNVTPNAGPIDPLIGPLQDNGGLTRTHRLLPGSPAIDAASAADSPSVDQRGIARPQGEGPDIGSFERR